MRAVVQHEIGGPDVLRVEEVPRPAPLPTEVLVRVHAAGVNPMDWKTRAGHGVAGLLGEPPFTVGWDVAGIVEDGVTSEIAEAAQARGVRAVSLLVEPDGNALGRIAELVDAGEVQVEVEGVFPLEDASRAHAQGETGRTRGKLVLAVG